MNKECFIQIKDYINQGTDHKGKVFIMGSEWNPREWFLQFPKIYRLMTEEETKNYFNTTNCKS